MAKIEDFEKRYVSYVDLCEGDLILVTKENIEPLRNLLKHTNFHWITGHQIVEYDAFDVNRVIQLHHRRSSYTPVYNVRYGRANGIKAINYIFIEC